MKKLYTLILFVLISSILYADSNTNNFGIIKIDTGTSDVWGAKFNNNMDTIHDSPILILLYPHIVLLFYLMIKLIL